MSGVARVPSYEKTTSLVARMLGVAPAELVNGFRPAVETDLPQVLAMRRGLIGDALTWDDERYLRWRYHLGSNSSGRGECWIATRGSEVLGTLGSESIVLSYGDFTVPGLSVMDIAVRTEFEGAGLGPWMAMTLCRRVPCTIAVGSNPKSRAIVSRVLHRVPDRRCYNYYVKFEDRFYRRLRSRIAAGALAAVAERTMKTWRSFTIQGNSALEVRAITRFDDSVEPLLARAQNPKQISLQRTHEFLNWRLFDSPRASYTVWGAYDGSELVGYMAVHNTADARALPEIVIEDWIVARSDSGAEAFRVMLGDAIDLAFKTGCAHVTVIASDEPSERVMRRVGFMVKPNDWETLSVHTSDERLQAAIAAGAPWHVTGANTDRDT